MSIELYDHRGQPLDASPSRSTRDWRDSALDMMLAETERLAQEAAQAVSESISQLELPLEDQGWRRLTTEAQYEFSPRGRWLLYQISRMMYLKNPLIRRGVTLKVIYVWGLGWSIKCDAEVVNDVIQEFIEDPRNKVELTSAQARDAKDVTQQVTGNTFLVLFPNTSTGLLHVRSIMAEEIVEIICDPEDAKTPWFYKRVWTEEGFDFASGTPQPKLRTAYYPDWEYQPQGAMPSVIGQHPVMVNNPVYHVKTGALDTMKFGLPEYYPAIDWARAAKEQLEDWATVRRALAQFAMKLNTARGPRGVAAAKARMGTTVDMNSMERNPASLPGSTFISTEGTDVQAFETRHAAQNPDEGRRLWLMNAMVFGVPETMFGDANVGNHATAKTLDRPTELMMRSRQGFWAEVFGRIFQYVIDWSIRAPNGLLKGSQVLDRNGDPKWVPDVDPETGEPISRNVQVVFQDILEQDITARVDAIMNAATLAGHPQSGTIPPELTSTLFLSALGVQDIDEVIAEMYPEDQTGAEGEPMPQDTKAAVAEVREAFREPKDAISGVLEPEAVRESEPEPVIVPETAPPRVVRRVIERDARDQITAIVEREES